MPDYIPAGDQDLDAWLENYDTKITATPTAYGLVAGDATALATLVTDFQSKLAICSVPSTRTAVTIQAKDTARQAVVTKARALAAIIQADPDTTNLQRAELGLTVRDEFPTAVGPPITKPVVNVEDIGNLQHVLRVRDEATPLSNAKPVGAHGAEVYVLYGEVAPASLAGMTYKGITTTALTTVVHDVAEKGKTAWFRLRWLNPTGQPGPISDEVSATVAA